MSAKIFLRWQMDMVDGGILKHKKVFGLAAVLVFASMAFHAVIGRSSAAQTDTVGIFQNHADVGTVLHPGSTDFDPAKSVYTLTASGENVWSTSDAFQFAWQKVSGDVSLAADVSILTVGGNEHRKAMLMFRQSLDADSPYADVTLHGSGLTSLQYREEKGEPTHEIETNISMPSRLRIEKRGDYVYVWLGAKASELAPSGASMRIHLRGDFYAGIGLCSHDKDAVVKAEFSKVSLGKPTPASSGAKATLYSTLETVDVGSTDRKIVYTTADHFEAPNWTRDGGTFLFNMGGRIYKLPASGGTPAVIDTGFAVRCNNDHGISPDSKWLAISDNSQGDHESMVYVVPLDGGTPRQITRNSPSYWHGWSPDGNTLAFVGQRNGDFDIYTIPLAGGEETRLTTAKGLDDGPEYSPDGQFIYFNSERAGKMQIWRMRADGSEQTQITSDEFNNWFPHISPDGKRMSILSYGADVVGHPEGKDVTLRVMSLADGKIQVVSKLFGGQGTINVPSWAPDSRHFAFVSYELLPSNIN